MIKYHKQIQIDRLRNGAWRINTDCGDVYDTSVYSQINPWWENQNGSELRHWQKDVCVAMFGDIVGPMRLFDVYKRGQGYNQPHDICLIHSENFKLWVLSTRDNFWICESDGGNIVFDVKDSMGSILNPLERSLIYQAFNQLKKQYNPENICRYYLKAPSWQE
jgi:hypothetical protein